jgi:hypothetical protein
MGVLEKAENREERKKYPHLVEAEERERKRRKKLATCDIQRRPYAASVYIRYYKRLYRTYIFSYSSQSQSSPRLSIDSIAPIAHL